MFRFFNRGRPKEPDGSIIAFDLQPLYDSLTARQKSEFESQANALHLEIHQMATVYDFAHLMKCCLRKSKNGSLGVASPNETAMFLHDSAFARRTLEIYFPISQFESVKALRQFIPNNSPPNDVLSIISGEAAIRALRQEFYSNGQTLS